jgi:hypothetical protein
VKIKGDGGKLQRESSEKENMSLEGLGCLEPSKPSKPSKLHHSKLLHSKHFPIPH